MGNQDDIRHLLDARDRAMEQFADPPSEMELWRQWWRAEITLDECVNLLNDLYPPTAAMRTRVVLP